MPDSSSPDVVTFSPFVETLGVDRDLVVADLGYRNGEAPDMVREFIDELLPQLPSHVEIRCGFRILPPGSIDVAADAVTANGVQFSTGPIIASQLKRSTSLALFVSTVGPQMERWSAQLMAKGDMMKGFLVDALASEVVERASVWLEQRVVDHVAPRGWKITNRYSPGYCDWAVAEQQKLFSLLPRQFCGITLTASSLMVPIKSLSGIIGLGPDVKRGAFQCSICDMKDCYRRRDDAGPAREKG